MTALTTDSITFPTNTYQARQACMHKARVLLHVAASVMMQPHALNKNIIVKLGSGGGGHNPDCVCIEAYRIYNNIF